MSVQHYSIWVVSKVDKSVTRAFKSAWMKALLGVPVSFPCIILETEFLHDTVTCQRIVRQRLDKHDRKFLKTSVDYCRTTGEFLTNFSVLFSSNRRVGVWITSGGHVMHPDDVEQTTDGIMAFVRVRNEVRERFRKFHNYMFHDFQSERILRFRQFNN